MAKQRLFLSFNPEEQFLSFLRKEQDDLKILLQDKLIRWEDPEKFHLTLRFLGDIDEEKTEPLIDTLSRLKFDFDKVKFIADKVDFFPNKRFPNIIFVSLNETGKNTETLVGFIDKIIYNFGVKPDKKFIPHITLGRFNRNKRQRIDSSFSGILKPAEIEFDSFCLMRSKLMAGGSEYEIISKFNFNN